VEFTLLSAVICSFICVLSVFAKTVRMIFIKYDGKVAHGPQRNPLDVCGNPDGVTLLTQGYVKIMVRIGLWLRLGGVHAIFCNTEFVEAKLHDTRYALY